MALPVHLPLPLAEARPIEALPADVADLALEAKVDGWRLALDTERSQAFGRRGTNLTARFADVAEASRQLGPAILDGELLALDATGAIDFTAIQRRSPRGPRAGENFKIVFAAFDLLALGTTDLRPRPYHERRAELEQLLRNAPATLTTVPAAQDLPSALAWLPTPGVEGLVLKRTDAAYQPGKTASGWLKWRERHPLDLVVVGVTATDPAHQALVLAQPNHAGRLRPVAVTLPIGPALRTEIAPLLHPEGDVRDLPETVVGLPGAGRRGRYLPVLPEVVLEVRADQATPEFGRFRHHVRAGRIRYDMTPADVLPMRSAAPARTARTAPVAPGRAGPGTVRG
ncbi:ATP-dependent DNA ligase [Kitasatospora sp. NPDC018058]|uniref:ATP-dependent DNA ligase n=1 Tax=Kitasatospora sp. NPDC018058 TaxID=3364025 RepID=UPI0037BF9664